MENFLNIDWSVFTSLDAWIFGLGIFALRVSNSAIDTIRILFMVRGKRMLSWICAFLVSLIYIVVISSVLSDLRNPLIIIMYSSGYATGNVLGMWLEDKLALGHLQLTIISNTLGTALAETLRENGFAVTEIPARGKDGMVTVLQCDVHRKQLAVIETLAQKVDPNSFITAEEVRPVRRGFWRSIK
ncbi:MAG: DUF2179 domain-containing protein [Anaerolineaceae bacterium]|nr:DUF2179 domain-containing protein [Anaerolineaceae bacterium]